MRRTRLGDPWQPPLDQPPLNEAEARRLLAGDFRDAYRQIIMRYCRPIYWYRLERAFGCGSLPQRGHRASALFAERPCCFGGRRRLFVVSG